MKIMERRKRAQERFPCFLDVVIDNAQSCKAYDISQGGIYVRTDNVLKPGSIVIIRLFSGNAELELKARVKHCVDGIGMGLMFIDLDTGLKTKIRAFLEEIKKIA